jgi:hypothetical protein
MALSVLRLYGINDRMNNQSGSVGTIKTGRKDPKVFGEKPTPVPLCITYIPRDLTWD